MESKTCQSCKIEIPLIHYYRCSLSSDGLYPRCKGCCRYYNSTAYRNVKAADRQPKIETMPLRVVNERFLNKYFDDSPGSFEPQLLNIVDSTASDLNLKLEINPLLNYYRSIFTNVDGELVRAHDCFDLKSLLNITAYFLADKSLYCCLEGEQND